MNRVEYKNIDSLRNKYQTLFDCYKLQIKWTKLRSQIVVSGGDSSLYPEKISNLFVSDFVDLAKIYYNYKNIVGHLSTRTKKGVEKLFNYTGSRASKIAGFFKNNSDLIQISTCCYCDMSYINTYTSNDGKKRSHFDIDHVIPKSICPITALSLFNFVPCCPVCNQRLKRDSFLADNVEEAMLLSPTNPNYNFDKEVHFRIIPNETYYSFNYREHIDKFRVELQTESSIYEKTIKQLHLEERYSFHKCEALNLMDLMQRYPLSHIKKIAQVLNEHGVCYSVSQIEEDIFGHSLIAENHRTFYKLHNDIYNTHRRHD